MLLTEEQKADLVNRLVSRARALLNDIGKDEVDAETGFRHRECRIPGFLVMEHQRQSLPGGFVKTSGLDIWRLTDDKARKALSMTYIPFQISVFDHAGKAPWITEFLEDAKPS